MSVLYLDCNTFVHCIKQKEYEILQKDRYISLWHPQKKLKLYTFQVFRGYIIVNYLDLQKIFCEDPELLHTLMDKYPFPIERVPYEDGLTYEGIMYHYAFEFKLASIGKTINVVTSNFNENTKDFSGLCLDNGHKVISIKRNQYNAFFEIVQRVVDGYLSIEELYKREHFGKEPVPLLKVNDKDFLEKFAEYKKSKKSMDLNRMLNDKIRPYLEGYENMRKISPKAQIDFIYYPIALFSLPRICSEINKVEKAAFFIISKGGSMFEQHSVQRI